MPAQPESYSVEICQRGKDQKYVAVPAVGVFEPVFRYLHSEELDKGIGVCPHILIPYIARETEIEVWKAEGPYKDRDGEWKGISVLVWQLTLFDTCLRDLGVRV